MLDAWHCVTWEPAIIQGNNVTNTYGTPYPFNATGGANDPYIIENFADGTVVSNNFWGFADAWPTGLVNGIQATLIEIFGTMSIIGNDFADVDPPAVIGIIEVFTANCTFIGNRFPFAPTTGPNMKDWNGDNYYYGNSRLFTSNSFPPFSGPITAPAGDGFAMGLGLRNTIEGMRSFNTTGSTGSGSIVLVDYKNPFGLAQTKGYAENTGVNNLTITEEYIIPDGTIFTRTTTPVAAGSKVILDPFDFTGLGAIDPRVIRYRVSAATIAGSITCTTHFAAPCGVFST